MDLRANSPTLLQWYAKTLSADDGQALLIPEGFAHGFQALSDDSEMLYMHTEAYSPQAEAAVRFDDQRLGIKWPLPVTEISERDLAHPSLEPKFSGIKI